MNKYQLGKLQKFESSNVWSKIPLIKVNLVNSQKISDI